MAKTKPSGRRVVFYRTPCGRRLRSLHEVENFLDITGSNLAIDNFCCDTEVHAHHEFIPVKVGVDRNKYLNLFPGNNNGGLHGPIRGTDYVSVCLICSYCFVWKLHCLEYFFHAAEVTFDP